MDIPKKWEGNIHCTTTFWSIDCPFLHSSTESELLKFYFLQYLSKKLGADPIVFGYLQTTFAVVQLCGGPLFGRFGDLFGSRAALSLAFLAASVSYGILGMSTSVTMLFLSRLPSVFMHAMQGN